MPAPKNEAQTARSPENKGFAISVDDREAVLQPTGHALFEEAVRTGMEFRGVKGMALPAPVRTPSTFDDLGDGAKPAASRLGPVEGFIKSTISAAAPESIGMDAMEGVEEWRAEHPKADFLSEAIGIGAPMAIGVGVLPKLAVKLPMVGARYAGALARAGQIEGAFARGAVQEVVRLAPLEVGLIGAGAGVSVAEGDTKALSRTVSRAATDMALVGVTGGVLTKIPTMRPFSRLQRQGEERIQASIIHNYVVGDSAHARVKKLVALEQAPKWGEISEADQATVQEVKAQLKKEIRAQVPHKGLQAPVENLTVGDSKKVSELFRVGKQKRGWTGYIAEPGKGEGRVSSATDWAEFKGRLDMEALPDWEANTQFFRYLKANTPEGSKVIQRTMAEEMDPVAPGLWMSKEVDGAYVMAKRLKVKGKPPPGAKTGKGAEGDLFAVWKTDAPGIWEPEAAKYGGTLVEHAFKYREIPLLRGSLKDVPLAKDVDELVNKVFPASVVTGVERAPSRVATALVGEAGAADLAAAGEVFKEGAKTYAAPSLMRYSASPTASRLSSIARASFSKANAYAHDIFYGKPIVSAGGSAIKKIFQQRPEAVGGILPFIERLEAATGEEGAEQFTRAVVSGMSPKEAKAAGMNFHVVELLRKLDKVDGPLFKQTQAVYEAGGKKAIEPLKNHYMMVRGWRGDTRLDLFALKADGSRGAKIAIASGKNAPEAIKEAQLLSKELAKDGKKIVFDRQGTYASTRELDGELAASIDWSHPDAQSARFLQASKIARSGTPGRFKPRTDMGGYEGQLRPLTYKEIRDSVFNSVKGMMNTQSETLLRNIYLGDELLRLRASQGSLFGKAEFPQIAEALDRYINLAMGRPTAMTQQMNRAVDRVLAPILGANSATKIAFGLNKAMFTLTLGALDLGFPVMNSMTWMQTVLPEVSMTLTAPKASLMAYYDPLLVSGRKTGMSTMWQMSPLRIAVKAFKNMHAPDQVLREHLRQATREAVLNPKFAEEFLGDSTTSALKALQKSDFVGMLDAINSWLPGRSEEFSRLHSFTTGHIIGRDFFELEGERLFQFAKKFTERTMFNYGTMDRPAMITGPVGSLFGLFKNWSMHYLWNLGAYGKQGWQENNWSPFLWGMAGTGMVAGGMGVPGYFVADGMSRVLTDKPLMQNLYAEWGEGADLAMYGLPSLIDVATAGRADAPGADAVRDINGLLGVATLRRMRDTYEFGADAIDRWKLTGQWPWESQSGYDKFAMAFLPRTAQRGLQVLGQDVVRSMRTQNAIVDGLSATDSLMFTFFGFQPINMAKSFEVDSEKWKNNEARKAEIQYLGDAIGEAIAAGDHVTQSILWKQALERGVPLDSIARSSAANVQARTITAEQRRGHDPKNIQLQMDVMGEE